MIDRPTEPKDDSVSKLGRSVWFDIPITNLADAMSFYEGLLGWTYSQMEDSPLADYVMIQVNGKLIGGLRRMPASGKEASGKPAEAWAKEGPILYFTVENLTQKIQRAKELGAQLIGEVVDLKNGRGRYQWVRDREGNLIGLWGPE